MIQIKNKEDLIKKGVTGPTRKARAIALETIEHALNSVDAASLVKSKVTRKRGQLRAGSYSFDLSRFRNVYVVGGGKAAGSMAETLEELLGSRVTEGFVNVPHGDEHKTAIIELQGTSHPIPDVAGVKGTRRMLELAEKAGEHDLFIVLISGGGSSLMPLPRDGVSLHDKQKLTSVLLKSGAGITEVNAVRRHLSCFKGGWFAKTAHPATILNLIISDVVGDSLEDIASGPTVPDPTTFANAQHVLQRFDLWEKAPESIRHLIINGERGLVEETPKPGDPCFQDVYSVVLGNCRTAAAAAVQHLRSKGLNTLLLTSVVEGEARTAGTLFSSIAAEIAVSGNPVRKPAGVVVGGETVVTVRGKGLGGRNQEFALSASLGLQGVEGAVVASVNTDGVDGPTDAAGAIVDEKTVIRARHLGLEPELFLAESDSYNFFTKLGDLILTGPTGTNVNDISLIVVL
jgi:glycerate 2-kinase